MTPLIELHSSAVFSHGAYDPQAAVKAEFSRLIHAALINKRFREMLLVNPLLAIETGYCGESFHFPSELKERIQHIHAETLEVFSAELIQTIDTPSISTQTIYHYR
jgi:hypothetical protein